MKKSLVALFLMGACLLTACSAPATSQEIAQETAQESTTASTVETPPATEETPAVETPAAETEDVAQADAAQADVGECAVVYIGTAGRFTAYDTSIPVADFANGDDVNLYLESLIAEIGTLTGWDLSCSVSSYRTVGVEMAPNNTVFSHPPEPQVEEFHMFDQYQLVETILDSIQKTIQMNLVGDAGDPDALAVYFSTEDGEDLIFPDIAMYVPMEEAYTGFMPIAG